MITTKKFKLDTKEYFNILLIRYIKRRWWSFILLLIIATYILLKGKTDSFDNFMLMLVIIYPILIVLQFWRYANSKDNKIFLVERYYEIDNDAITGIVDNNAPSSIKLEYIIKFDTIKQYYLLYISKHQFLCIPIDSFKSNTDKEYFENEIIKKFKDRINEK